MRGANDERANTERQGVGLLRLLLAQMLTPEMPPLLRCREAGGWEVSDCDIPVFYGFTEPVARKDHKCCECRATIFPGEKYVRCNIKMSGESPETFTQHTICAEACEYYRDKIGEECLHFGGLLEWWGEDGHFNSKKDPVYKEARRLIARVLWRKRRPRPTPPGGEGER